MTSTGSTATVYEFNIPEERPADTPSVKFRINGEPFVLDMPKVAIAVELTALMDGGALRENASVADIGARLTSTLWQMVMYVREEPPEPYAIEQDGRTVPNPNAGRARGQQRIVQRLRNPKDGLDILDLADLFQTLTTAMFDRPTGPSPASSDAPGDGGSDSAAGTPEQPAATSGT